MVTPTNFILHKRDRKRVYHESRSVYVRNYVPYTQHKHKRTDISKSPSTKNRIFQLFSRFADRVFFFLWLQPFISFMWLYKDWPVVTFWLCVYYLSFLELKKQTNNRNLKRNFQIKISWFHSFSYLWLVTQIEIST
jgi:hypothetical protein